MICCLLRCETPCLMTSSFVSRILAWTMRSQQCRCLRSAKVRAMAPRQVRVCRCVYRVKSVYHAVVAGVCFADAVARYPLTLSYPQPRSLTLLRPQSDLYYSRQLFPMDPHRTLITQSSLFNVTAILKASSACRAAARAARCCTLSPLLALLLFRFGQAEHRRRGRFHFRCGTGTGNACRCKFVGHNDVHSACRAGIGAVELVSAVDVACTVDFGDAFNICDAFKHVGAVGVVRAVAFCNSVDLGSVVVVAVRSWQWTRLGAWKRW